MEDKKEYLTKKKHDELTKELGILTHDTRKEVAEKLEYAKSLGDLSENAEYQEARDEQARVEYRISQLEELLKNAEIIKHKEGDTAEAGSTVTIKKGAGAEQTYELVGSEEADMTEGKLSYSSPLGRALMGKKKGETFTFETPKGNTKYKIVSVK
ncbi:transcription elongation factor GreA [Candidatus Pacebacteria bacterium]|nr:transcription elongation factor GreA [Candidatus Paceibacterota bacterium]